MPLAPSTSSAVAASVAVLPILARSRRALALRLVDVGGFAGGISNIGTISARPSADGIYLDNITGFLGGISNSGKITAGSAAIELKSIGTFSGGIGNSGTLRSTGIGIYLSKISQFSNSGGGGISNSGTIFSTEAGIDLFQVTTFLGGISDTGTISVGGTGIGIWLLGISTFFGNVINAGMISAADGVEIDIGTVSGQVIDSGTILAASHGIVVESGSNILAGNAAFAIDVTGKTFTGGIVNSGVISGSGGIDITQVSGVSIFDAGSILASGGTAIEFDGTGNTLTLGAGYTISGIVDPQSGTNTLDLGGSASDTFDLSSVGAGEQYRGFTVFNVAGGTWGLTGSGSGWIVESGGTAEVTSGADLSGSTVRAGGVLIVESGGSISGVTVSSGGIAVVLSGGSGSATLLAGAIVGWAQV